MTSRSISRTLFNVTSLILVIGLVLVAGRYFYVKHQYPITLSTIENKRTVFATAYQEAVSQQQKSKIISQARIYLEKMMVADVFPAWYGNPWTFNGDASQPFEGTVACGSFVENTLVNTGFRLDQRLSAQPSETIIKNLLTSNNVKRFSNVPMDDFIGSVKANGDGLYVVGLDTHVGYLNVANGEVDFIHSHGYLFVMSEAAKRSITLRNSKYKVIGKLFDDELVEKWLLNRKVPLKYNYFTESS